MHLEIHREIMNFLFEKENIEINQKNINGYTF
jgi:hypothetical protein